MKALVLDGQVVQVSSETFEVHSSMRWVDAPEEVTAGWQILEDGTWSNPFALSAEQQAAADLEQLRMQRNGKLRKTDMWALSDRTMSAEMTAYRQALRDITDTYTNVTDVVWPDLPPELS